MPILKLGEICCRWCWVLLFSFPFDRVVHILTDNDARSEKRSGVELDLLRRIKDHDLMHLNKQ